MRAYRPVCHVLLAAALALAAVVTVPAGPARADVPELQLSVTTGPWFTRSASMDPVAADDVMALFELGTSVQILRGLPIVDRLYAELHYGGGGTSALDFQALDCALGLDTLDAGARASRPLTSFLSVHVRAALGAARGSFDVSFYDGGERRVLADTSWSPAAYLGGGFELHRRTSSRFSLGLRAELGYQAIGELEFAAQPSNPDDSLARIPTVAAALGGIDPSGLQLRFGVVGSF